MTEWKPIETAPKDGTRVLVSDGRIVWLAYWAKEAVNTHDDFCGDCWAVYQPDDEYYSFLLNDIRLTNWMPLPEPPKVRQT